MSQGAGRPIRSDEKIWTVAELTGRVKSVLEGSIPPIWVEGEVSNFVHHSSGHMYFSLKDDRAQLRCVFFRGRNRLIKFKPESGMKVRARGEITVYERSGQYQMMVSKLEPAGEGELELAFRQLVASLQKEGLFREELKKPLPTFPKKVGVVTSPTGAAVHDMIRVLSGRFPVEVILYPVRVQGEGAAGEIAHAIQRFNELGAVDVMIVGRGGGSLEDLWAFNEEIVARSIHESTIPVISAVGHEVDVTISDMVADLRCPTPTAAAEQVVPSLEEVDGTLTRQEERLARRMLEKIRFWKERLTRYAESRALGQPRDLLRQEAQRLDDLTHRLAQGLRRVEERLSDRIRAVAGKLTALDPLAVLERGYSICRSSQGGKAITNAKNVNRDDPLFVRFRRGSLEARVVSIHEQEEGEES